MLKPFLIGSAALTALVFGTAVLHAQEGSDTVPPEVDGMEEVVEEGMSPEVAEEGMSPEVVEEGVSSEVIEDGVPSEVVEDGTSPEVEDGISSEVVEDEVSSDIDLPEIDTDPSAQVPDNLMDSPEAEMFVSKGVEPANTVAQNDSELSGDPTSEGEAIAAEDISEAELQQIAPTVADLD